jgi:hypothetical protein
MDQISEENPVFIARYGADNDLLDLHGWKCFNRLVTNKQRMKQMIAKTTTKTRSPQFQFCYSIPQKRQRITGTRWKDEMKEEIDSLNAYDTF